jgi:hypothetical protein
MVEAESVYSTIPVVWCLETFELSVVWDYAGKLWTHLGGDVERCLLQMRLRSPPGKITRDVTFLLCNKMLAATFAKGWSHLTRAQRPPNINRAPKETSLELDAQS